MTDTDDIQQRKRPKGDAASFETARYVAYVAEQAAQLAEAERASPPPAEPGPAEPEAPKPAKAKSSGRGGARPGAGRPRKHHPIAVPASPDEMRKMLRSIDGFETLKKIIQGAEMQASGPTGKPMLVRPTVGERLTALKLWVDRLLPTLTAQELKADVTSVSATVDGRTTARAIVDFLRDSRGTEPDLWRNVAGEAKAPPVIDAPIDAPMSGQPTELPAWAHSPTPSQAVVHLEEHRRNLHAARPDERPPPGTVGPPPRKGLEDGERIMTTGGLWVEYAGVTNNDGREKFWLCDKHGQRVMTVWGREEAIAKSGELASKGSISK
jgi:hypothetical protein